jgi:poly(A) polymerase
VIDYVGGLEDLEARLIRTIGDPDVRFREDPVRMLRGVEFASRLGFAITPDAYEAILAHRKEIAKSAPPRVTEELGQALKGGHALPTFLMLRELGLLDVLLPELASVLREPDPEHPHGAGHLFWALLEVFDAERRRGRVFEDAAVFALLFLPIVREKVRRASRSGEPSPGLLLTILEEVVNPIALRMALPNAVTHRIKQALAIVGKLSYRPEPRVTTRRLTLREAFPTALDLFELRAMATGRGGDLAREWRTVFDRARAVRDSYGPPEKPPGAPARRRRRGGRRRV